MIEALEDRCLLDGSWTRLADMPTARTGLAAAALNGQLYAATGVIGGIGGGTTVLEAYDPTTDSWAPKRPISTARSYAGAASIGGKLYVVGGCDNSDCRIGTTNRLEVYDPIMNTWMLKRPMPTARSQMAVAAIDGKLYVAGGVGPSPPSPVYDTLEVYDPIWDTWMTKTHMLTRRRDVGGAVINNQLYVVGGLSSGETVVATLEVYDPGSDTWMTKSPMPAPRAFLGAGAVAGILYAVSGQSASGTPVNTVEAYDPVRDRWRPDAPIPTARFLAQPATINGMLYVAGNGPGNTAISTLEAFTPTTLTATGATLSATVGERFAAVVASFTDSGPNPGAATDYSAVINWGDSSRISTGGISDNGDGTYDVAASHTYSDPSTYTATITITDNRDTTRQATATSTIEVTSPSAPSHGSKRAVFADVAAALPPSAAEPANIHRPDAGKQAILARPLPSLVRQDASEIRSIRESVAAFATETSGILARQVGSTPAVFGDPLTEWQPIDQINAATVDLLADNLLAG